MASAASDVDNYLLDGLPPREIAARSFVGELHAKQREFLALPHLNVLYGGAAGGGKTEALLADALQYIDRPQYSALILRRTYTALNLRGSIMARALEWCGREHWQERDKRFVFPSGATIQFGYCDSEADKDRYQSAQFHRIYIDELTEWPEAWFAFLFSRLRKVVGDDIPVGFRCGTNPGGIGGEWVRARFGIPEGEVIDAPIVAEDRCFFPARAEDNPSLDLTLYEKSLKELGEAKYQQLRWGRWVRDGEGLVYSAFSDANIIDAAPKCDRLLLAQDYGVTNATSWSILGWREFDPTVYVLRSWKKSGVTPSENAEMVQALERVWKFERIVGDIGGLGKAFAEEAVKRFHLPIEAADKNNKRGYIDLFNGDLKRRRVAIVGSECADLVHELKTLPWAEDRQKEAPGFANHCADGTLYGWRAATAYLAREAPSGPEPGTREADEAEAAAATERRRAEAARAAAGPRTTRDAWRPTRR